MNLSGVDLNLLVVLHAVLEERSATRAAARLHLTQSAVSNAVARLRLVLGDPLVVRTGRGLSPTPAAQAIYPRLHAALTVLDGVVNDLDDFDLATTTREWVIAFADLYGPVLLPELHQRLLAQSPGSRLRVVSLDRISITDALATGELDLYLGIPSTTPTTWRSEHAFTDDIVGLMAGHHSASSAPIDLDTFLALPQVAVRISAGRGREVDDALARIGRHRDIRMIVPHHSSAASVVEKGVLVTTAPRRLAHYYAARSDLNIFEVPLELPGYDVRLHWHPRVEKDAGVLAFKETILDVLTATS